MLLAPTRCLLAHSWEAEPTTGAIGKFKESCVFYADDISVTQTN